MVIVPAADVGLVMTGPRSVQPGSPAVYTIAMTNTGPSEAEAVVVSDVTPVGLAFVSNAGDCLTAFPCTLGRIPVGATRTITATFDVPHDYRTPNPILNSASVTTSTADPGPSGNTATVTSSIAMGGAGCDVNGDGVNEIVTGAGPDRSGDPTCSSGAWRAGP